MRVISIPPDGLWHRVPSRHAEGPTLPWLQLAGDEDGCIVACNTGSRPVDVVYEEED